MKKGSTELVFILDKSGSMSGLEADTIGGFNSMLKKQKESDDECRITTVFFDHTYEIIHDRIDIKAVHPITDKDYQVGGSTALLDAIGKTIQKMVNVQKHSDDAYRAEKVLFVIITDGEENASREYSAKRIKKRIAYQKSHYSWEFIFLGANIDAVETAGRFGISAERAIDYVADSRGTHLNFQVMANAVRSFRESGSFEADCFDEIRADKKKRGGQS